MCLQRLNDYVWITLTDKFTLLTGSCSPARKSIWVKGCIKIVKSGNVWKMTYTVTVNCVNSEGDVKVYRVSGALLPRKW